MTKKKIQFLKPVDIKRAWSKEDKDFTPWIASREVLGELFDACEIDAGSDFTIRTEVVLPGLKRKLDVLVETEGGDKIALENQFSSADHDHLTRALAYAVGLEARTVIIVAESHRAEFVHVADYLNGAAGAFKENGIRIFLVAIELYGATDSDRLHPRFEVQSQPDEWSAAIHESSQSDGASSNRDALIFNFHESLLPRIRETSGIFKNVSSSWGSWKAGSFGISGIQVRYDVSRESVVVQLWFHRKRSEENLAALRALEKFQKEIDARFAGLNVQWRGTGTAFIEVRLEGIGWASSPTDQSLNELALTVAKMAAVGKKYLPEIRAAVENA